MADEEPKFYPFKFKKNNDEDRARKIEELKKKFNLQRVLQLIEKGELTEDDDENSAAAKINRLQAVENLEGFQENLAGEEQKLAKRLQDLAGKDIDKDKLEEEIQELAQKDDGFEQRYQKYLEEKAALEQEADSQTKTERLAQLEAENKDNIDKHNELEAVANAAVDCKRAEFFAGLPKENQENLIQFAKNCSDKGRLNSDENRAGFKEVLDNLRTEANNGFAPRRREDGKIENDHRFKLDDKGLIRHEIHNLGGSDLDICIVNGEFSFLKNKDLSEEQLKALAQYCYKNGLEIADYAALNGLKVQGTEDKLGDRLQKETENLHAQSLRDLEEQDQATKDEIERNRERAREGAQTRGANQEEIDRAVREADGLPSDLSTRVGAFGSPEASADDNEDFCQFIPPQKEIKMDRKEITKKAHARIGMFAGLSDPTLRRVTRYGNSTIISVYASEEDMRIDGERDKNGKRVHSKQFSVELDFSVPPKPRFYMGNVKEFKCDHARLMLDPYKTAGYKYFMIPPVIEIGGKVAGGAFMEASVKTQMIPYLKRSTKSKGCDVGTPDLETVFKKMSEEGDMKGVAKAEYMMRWYRELKAYNKRIDDDTGKPVKPNSQLVQFQEQFRVGANFVQFQASHQESLEDYIADKFKNSQKSDNEKRVDKITATIAMTKILQDLQKGKLNGKIFNPLNNKEPSNDQLFKDALDAYMEKENANVTNRFNDLVESYSNRGNSKTTVVSDKAEDNAMNAILREYTDPKEGEMSKTLARLKGYGVELQHPNIAKPRILGDRSSSREDDDEKKRRTATLSNSYSGR